MLGFLTGAPPGLISLVVGSFFIPPGSFLASDRRYSSIKVFIKPTALIFWQTRGGIKFHFPRP